MRRVGAAAAQRVIAAAPAKAPVAEPARVRQQGERCRRRARQRGAPRRSSAGSACRRARVRRPRRRGRAGPRAAAHPRAARTVRSRCPRSGNGGADHFELGLQVVGAGDRVEVVRRDLDEAERRVQLARRLHVVERVEQHRRVAGAARLVEECLREQPAEAEAAECRSHVEALHLAGVAVLGVGERPERAAAGELAADEGEQQVAARRGVLARQRRELLLEVLEAQVDSRGWPRTRERSRPCSRARRPWSARAARSSAPSLPALPHAPSAFVVPSP